MQRHLVWLRNDLRLADNPALYAACQDPKAEVIALWFVTTEQWQQHHVSARQLKYLHDSLAVLSHDLAKLGIPLQIVEVADFAEQQQQLLHYCQQHQVNKLFYNYQYEINERQRDQWVEKNLPGHQVTCQGFHEATLVAPGSLVTGQGKMYQVFTPFKRAMLQRLAEQPLECYPTPARRAASSSLKASAIGQFYPRGTTFDDRQFAVGHHQAVEQLNRFLKQGVIYYGKQRDFPAKPGTSSLSPALCLGVLSARQCAVQLLKQYPDALNPDHSAAVWLGELIWRDFYRHLLVAWPDLCRHRPFQPWTDKVSWLDNPDHFSAWCRGETGFPIVDAAMRQLNSTGWMHNRLRMICASFLVKDLLIDWRKGERYFIEQLIDGDLAANNGGWQWAASTGTDAAPYFRIFNPTRQAERFDPKGEFIRQWLPELASVPTSAIHQPWLWAKQQGQTLDYPQPLVDHNQARKRTLAAFEAARN